MPQEWNIRDAYIADTAGNRVVDFAASSLHVLGYSVPVSRTVPLAELRAHLHTLPDHPSWVPYRTSYYKPEWGFCLAQETLDGLPDGEYEVRIDSTLADGHLTYAEHVVPGQVSDEVLVSCHVCHPSLANDNLAGIAVATFLARALAELGRVLKTLHLLEYACDEAFRRRILGQLNRHERRHRLARVVFHGKQGELRQRYLSNSVYPDQATLDAAVGRAWRDLTDDCARLVSLCDFGWIRAARAQAQAAFGN